MAAWKDDTNSNAATAAKVLPAPTGSCSYTNTLLDRRFVFTWRFPAGSGYNLANVRFVRATSLTNPALIELPATAYSTTGPNAGGDYTTTINAGRLAGNFDGMYSDTTTFKLGLRSTEKGWNSTATTVNSRLNVITTGGTCAG